MICSMSIMAHPDRTEFVEDMLEKIPMAKPVWDRVNNEWDTARRALADFHPDAEWHVVIQDDAIPCNDFQAGVVKALIAISHHGPVSFYTGQGRPYAREVERLVRITEERSIPWFSASNGPYWGVCVAFPTDMISDLLKTCDESTIDNYDARLSDYFKERKIATWYSMPSLVDHRDQSESPSLIPGHGSSSGRVAHRWIGRGSPLAIDWSKDAYHAGDQAEYWDREFACTRCACQSPDLAGAILHAIDVHELGPVDLLATTVHHAEMLQELRDHLSDEAINMLVIAGPDLELDEKVKPDQVVRRHDAQQIFSRPGNYVICGATRDFRWVSCRAGWSLDGQAN